MEAGLEPMKRGCREPVTSVVTLPPQRHPAWVGVSATSTAAALAGSRCESHTGRVDRRGVRGLRDPRAARKRRRIQSRVRRPPGAVDRDIPPLPPKHDDPRASRRTIARDQRSVKAAGACPHCRICCHRVQRDKWRPADVCGVELGARDQFAGHAGSRGGWPGCAAGRSRVIRPLLRYRLADGDPGGG